MKTINIFLLTLLLIYNGCKKDDNPVGYGLLTSQGLKEHISGIYWNRYYTKNTGNLDIKIAFIHWSMQGSFWLTSY